MLFNEPKLLKYGRRRARHHTRHRSFSALQRAEIAEIPPSCSSPLGVGSVSVLFNEPKLLNVTHLTGLTGRYNRFSALQRAEIAEIRSEPATANDHERFSALQRAEIAEIQASRRPSAGPAGSFSALQRAEIAEIFWSAWRVFRSLSWFQCSSTSRNC